MKKKIKKDKWSVANVEIDFLVENVAISIPS